MNIKAITYCGILLLLSACAHDKNKCELPCVDDATDIESVYQYWGIDDVVVRLTAADYMLDVRYRVKDIEKSKLLFDRSIFPIIVRDLDGAQFMVPASEKLGVLRQAPRFVKQNKQYFMYFANPGKRIKRGETVTLMIGDFKLPNIPVQ